MKKYSSHFLFGFWVVVVFGIVLKMSEFGNTMKENNAYLRVMACTISIPIDERNQEQIDACWRERGVDPSNLQITK